jgi:hypothetical protein
MDPLVLQWIGCAFGVAGSVALALNKPWSGIGFVLFLISNGFWVFYGILTEAPGLVAMQVVFTITSLLGIWNWMLRPAPQKT